MARSKAFPTPRSKALYKDKDARLSKAMRDKKPRGRPPSTKTIQKRLARAAREAARAQEYERAAQLRELKQKAKKLGCVVIENETMWDIVSKRISNALTVRSQSGLKAAALTRIEPCPREFMLSAQMEALGQLEVAHLHDRVVSVRDCSDPAQLGKLANVGERRPTGHLGGLVHRSGKLLTSLVAMKATHTEMLKDSRSGVRREYLDLSFTLATVNERGGVHAPAVAADDREAVERFVRMQPWRLSQMGKPVSEEMLEFCAAAIVSARAEDAARRL